MMKKHFVFSYANILIREIERKKYFSFFRRIFGLIYKLIINLLKRTTNQIVNLDKKNNSEYFNLSLHELFKYFNSDKGKTLEVDNQNKTIKTHNYTIFYNKYFKNLKKKNIKILELGSHEGRGLASMYYYFPHSKLCGANINPFQMRFHSNRIEEIYIDVSSKKILKNFSKYFDKEFDIIIDDASHNLKDILQTLPILFKNLKENGFYVIEDINQFDVFKNLNPTNETLTPIKILKLMKEDKKIDSRFISEEDIGYLKKNISEYFFERGEMIVNGTNISDIVFLKKNA
jgi:hypothetical protein